MLARVVGEPQKHPASSAGMGFRRVRLLILAALMGMAVAEAVPAAAQPGSVSLTSLDGGGALAVVQASFDAAGSTTLWSAPGSRWAAQGRLVEGEVALDDGSRIGDRFVLALTRPAPEPASQPDPDPDPHPDHGQYPPAR